MEIGIIWTRVGDLNQGRGKRSGAKRSGFGFVLGDRAGWIY